MAQWLLVLVEVQVVLVLVPVMATSICTCVLDHGNHQCAVAQMLTVTWWTIGTLLLTNIFTIYIHFSHTLAGVVITSFTLPYLYSNPLQPHSIACASLWITARILTLICQWFLWPYCH